jgi:hypothetical protein
MGIRWTLKSGLNVLEEIDHVIHVLYTSQPIPGRPFYHLRPDYDTSERIQIKALKNDDSQLEYSSFGDFGMGVNVRWIDGLVMPM